MRHTLSDSFIGQIMQLDHDTLQYIAWNYEDAIARKMWKGQDLEKAKLCLAHIQRCLGQRVDATCTLSKEWVCPN